MKTAKTTRTVYERAGDEFRKAREGCAYIAGCVTSMEPVASHMIAFGGVDPDLPTRMSEILGRAAFQETLADVDGLHEYHDRIAAAYALGIAIGLKLRPEAFEGGAR